MQRYNIYINDALEMISRIERETKSINDLRKNKEMDSTLMRMQVIGESIKKIPKEIKRKYLNVKWKKIEHLRNIISHDYFKIIPELMMQIIKRDFPELKKGLINLK